MKSISGKNWVETNISSRLLEKVKIEQRLNDIQAKIIISRNFTIEELYTLKNKLDLSNPFLRNKDFILGCSLLKQHIQKKNKILIIGDYDVDGCLSTALMVNFFKKYNSKVDFYIPDRFKDGYGGNKDLITKLALNKKPNLVIFLDCGSTSHNSIKHLREKKIDTIIIDHHHIRKPYPISNVFINPKKKNNYNNFDYLCTAFLTYLFIDLYYKQNEIKSSFSNNLIYVLLATVSDVMPLRGINRLLAINVLKDFKISKDFIFRKIFELSNIKKKIQIDDFGFLIGPILNSAGRISNANEVVKLFTTNSEKEKNELVQKIFELNKKRKNIEENVLNNIDFNKIEKEKGIIFIYKPNISEGIIGIIASRIKEYFNRPCIILTNSSKIIKGSARSTNTFNIAEHIYEAIKKNILLSGGGHNLAAGVTLLKENLNLFMNFLNYHYNKNQNINHNTFISKISLNAINQKFIKDMNILGPFGHKNPNPIFLIENVKFIKKKILKNKYISCFLKNNNKIFKAISFNQIHSKVSYEILNSNNTMNVFVKLRENIFNNKSNIQVEIIDVQKTTINT